MKKLLLLLVVTFALLGSSGCSDKKTIEHTSTSDDREMP